MARKSKSKILILSLIALCLLPAVFIDFSPWVEQWIHTEPRIPSNPAPDLQTDESGLSRAVWVLRTSAGDIKIRFYSKDAPKTIAHLLPLIQSGFYDGLAFHRVIPGFILQTGDPSGLGSGGSGNPIPFETSPQKNLLGSVGLARDVSQLQSGDSQFYISLGEFPHLDGQFTVFGRVTEGIEIAQHISREDRILASFIE